MIEKRKEASKIPEREERGGEARDKREECNYI